MSPVNFYKIVCFISGACYVGSTCRPIARRLHQHEYNYRKYLENKNCFVTSFIILEKNNYQIRLIDSVECVDKKQRNTIELFHILNENSVNKFHPGRDGKQYKQDNKEKINEQNKQYHQDNKEKRNEYSQQYRQDNKEQLNEKKKELTICPCGGQYTRTHQARHMKSKKHTNYEKQN
jgi:hypothetical protein